MSNQSLLKPAGLFELGRVDMTLAAESAVGDNLHTLLERHASGAWSRHTPEAHRSNEHALRFRRRVVSEYPAGDDGGPFIVLETAADRSRTWVGLSQEFAERERAWVNGDDDPEMQALMAQAAGIEDEIGHMHSDMHTREQAEARYRSLLGTGEEQEARLDLKLALIAAEESAGRLAAKERELGDVRSRISERRAHLRVQADGVGQVTEVEIRYDSTCRTAEDAERAFLRALQDVGAARGELVLAGGHPHPHFLADAPMLVKKALKGEPIDVDGVPREPWDLG